MLKRAYHRRRSERGITLLETLFAVGSIALLIAVGTYVTAQIGKQTLFERTASQMLTIQRAAEEFAKSNFTQLVDPVIGIIPAAGQVRELTVAQLVTDNYLSQSVTDALGKDLRVRVFLRNDTTAGSLDAVEIVTATETVNAVPGIPFADLLDIASFGRGKLGVLANITPYDIANFRSVSGEWRVPLANLAVVPGGYAPGLPGAGQGSGYLAAYSRMSNEDIFDTNVLYRIPVAGNPALNTMNTDLSMGGFDLCGTIVSGICSKDTSTVTADRVNTRNVALTGDGGYALSTEGTLEMGALNVNGGLTVYGDNDAGTADLQITSLDAPDGTVSSATANAVTLSVGADGLIAETATTDTMTSNELIVNDSFQAAGTINTPTLQLGSAGGPALTSTTLSSRTMTAGSANVTSAFTANTGATHTVTQELRTNGRASLGALTADSVDFQNLCYTSAAEDGIPGC